MDQLPDELLLRIFLLLTSDACQLAHLQGVCRRFYRVAQDTSLWYTAFQARYPTWGQHVNRLHNGDPLIDWKDYVLHITQQNQRAQSFTVDFVPDETSLMHHHCCTAAAAARKVPQKRKLTERDMTSSSSTSTPSSPPEVLQPTMMGLSSSSSSYPIPSASSPAHKSQCYGIRSLSPIHTSASTPLHSSASSASSASTSPPPLTSMFDDNHEVYESSFLGDAQDGDQSQCHHYGLHQQQLHYPPPFRIQDPLVVDIDRITKTGIVATGKHRHEKLTTTTMTTLPPHTSSHYSAQSPPQSEHKILFWEYPSWRLLREFNLSFAPADSSCQITGIQSVRIGSGSNRQKIRLFSLAVGQPLILNNNNDDPDNSDDRVDLWQTVLVYRLFDNGATQCVAHIDMDGQLLGRDVFFFSEASWGRSNDGPLDDESDNPTESVRQWMEIVAPDHANFDPDHTVFMLAIGPDFPDVSGCGRLIKFDIRGDDVLVDPSTEPVRWDSESRRFEPLLYRRYLRKCRSHAAAAVVARIPMGRKISCMIHFRHPPHLNHLICTGSYVKSELTVYDWRFGIKVGVLPWRVCPTTTIPRTLTETPPPQEDDISMEQHHPEPHTLLADEEEHLDVNNRIQMDDNDMLIQEEGGAVMLMDDIEFIDEDDDRSIVQPWGLESTIVLPPYWSTKEQFPVTKEDFAQRGLRLIAVGDNRNDKLEIKVWDISYMLGVDWQPLLQRQQGDDYNDGLPTTAMAMDDDEDGNVQQDMSIQFSWWKRGTPALKKLARRMVEEMDEALMIVQNPVTGRQRLTTASRGTRSEDLPYSAPADAQSMILVHAFDKADDDDNADDDLDNENMDVMPIKYIAYNLLRTSLFLLTEEGKITVMDIETGRVIGTVDNVAADCDGTNIPLGPERKVRGIDVNVLGGREIVVTSRQGILRGTLT